MTIDLSLCELIVFAISLGILLGLVVLYYFKIQHLRFSLNQLLEDKAKLVEENDHYIEQVKNPLGPLFSADTTPLILSFDSTGKIIKANDSLLDKFGYTKKQLVGRKAIGTILPKPQKETDNMIYRLFKNPNLFVDAETEVQTKSGQKLWISWTNKIIYNSKGKPVAADAVGFDITKRKELEADLQYLSSIDPQTGAMNRPALLQTGATELKRAKRYGRTLSVAIFKFQIRGSSASLTDVQLKDATQLARQVVRSVDYLGRIGDTEFALILPETPQKNIPFLIQRLAKHLESYNKQNKSKLDLIYATAEFSKSTATIDELLASAWKKINKNPKQGI